MRITTIIGLAIGAAVVVGIFSQSTKPNMFTTAFSKHLKKALSAVQIASITAITQAFDQYGDGDRRKLIYIIALAYHESRLRPIKEIKAKPGTRVWDEYQIRYWNTGYFGRGFVQITWRANYDKMGKRLGIDLVNNPDFALKPDVAAKIIVVGMMEGMFTGKKLADYFNSSKNDPYYARRTVGAIMVDGKDTAKMIQDYATGIHKNITNA